MCNNWSTGAGASFAEKLSGAVGGEKALKELCFASDATENGAACRKKQKKKRKKKKAAKKEL
jgi:hypothetical protein